MKYTIDQLDDQVSREPSTIITHPAQVIATAPVGSGKTTLLNNLFRKKVFFKGFFDQIVIFSPLPLDLDPKWAGLLEMKHVLRKPPQPKLRVDNTNLIQLYDASPSTGENMRDTNPRRINPDDIYTEFDGDALMELLERQEERLKEGSFRLCIVFEDCPGLQCFVGKNGKVMQRLATLLRHYQATVFYCTQSYMLMPRTIRNNCTHMIVWNIQNISERRRIHAEHPMVGTFEKFNALFDTLMNTPGHPFIFFNFRNPVGSQVVLNFDRIVAT